MRSRHLITLSLLVAAVACTSCSSSVIEPFVLRIIADDGDAMGTMGNPIVLSAVDEILIVLTPDAGMGNTFAPFEMETFEGGEVETFLSSAGEWTMRITKPYIEAHATNEGTTFKLDVPLYATDPTDLTEVRDPTMRVLFRRRGEVIATTVRFLQWPLPEGNGIEGASDLTVTVLCPDATRSQCLNMDPTP